jgi:hypothetical protein
LIRNWGWDGFRSVIATHCVASRTSYNCLLAASQSLGRAGE